MKIIVIYLVCKDVQTMKYKMIYKIKRFEVKVLKYRIVSSAQIWTLHSVVDETVSLILMVNGTGPGNDPCGTPFITARTCDWIFPALRDHVKAANDQNYQKLFTNQWKQQENASFHPSRKQYHLGLKSKSRGSTTNGSKAGLVKWNCIKRC